RDGALDGGEGDRPGDPSGGKTLKPRPGYPARLESGGPSSEARIDGDGAARRRTADALVQHPGGPARAPPAAEGPARGPLPAQSAPGDAPRGVPPPGDLDGAVDPHSRGDPRTVRTGGAPPTVDPCTAAREGVEDAREAVLQSGVLQPDREPQGEHRPRAGVVCEAGGVR